MNIFKTKPQEPKEITLTKMSVATVKKIIKEKGKWHGYICPSNCYPNIGHPFNLAMEMTFNKKMLKKERPEDFSTPFEKSLFSFSFYNCTSETGRTIHFYEINK